MSRKKLVMIPSVGISLVVLSVAVVVMGGYIPHESEGHGFMVEQSAQVTAKRADVAVIGTIGDSSTYLIYHNVGNLIFPKVYTLTELTVSDVLLGDTGLQGDVITIRTLGGTYNSVTTTFSPVPDPLNSVRNAAFMPECQHHVGVTDAGQPCRARPPRHLTRDSGSRHGSGHIRQLAGP